MYHSRFMYDIVNVIKYKKISIYIFLQQWYGFVFVLSLMSNQIKQFYLIHFCLQKFHMDIICHPQGAAAGPSAPLLPTALCYNVPVKVQP